MAGVVAGVGPHAAQRPLAGADRVGASASAQADGLREAPFAWPWEISFQHIHDAMELRPYRVEQVRRIRDRSDGKPSERWLEVVERLEHGVPAEPGADAPYSLAFVDLLGDGYAAGERALAAREHGKQESLLYNFQSFRVFDAAAAAANYSIEFAGLSVRIERPVYRVVVSPTDRLRHRWLLELDVATGYPLYRGEYDADDVLVAEVTAREFAPGADDNAPLAARPSLWQRQADGASALQAIGADASSALSPSELPTGYAEESGWLVIDPLSGARRAMILYTDGIDLLFLSVAPGERPWGDLEGHVVGLHYDAAGILQATMHDAGFGYLVMQRGSEAILRGVMNAFYARIVSERRRRDGR